MTTPEALRRPIVCNGDGTVTITITHAQLLTLETFAAQPTWDQAKAEALEVLHQVRM